MALYVHDVILESSTGLPEDRVVNTWHTAGPASPAGSDWTTLLGLFNSLYNAVGTGQTHALSYYLSTELNRSASPTLKSYAIPATAGPTGSPVNVASMSALVAGGGTPLPAEVASCLSYHAVTASIPEESGTTRPAARRRGRVYLGPLSDRAVQIGVGGAGRQRPLTTFMNDVTTAASLFKTAALAAGWEWVVFSKTDWLGRSVIGGFMDDAFDTQRRRGSAASSRTTF